MHPAVFVMIAAETGVPLHIFQLSARFCHDCLLCRARDEKSPAYIFRRAPLLVSYHPETPDMKLAVSELESGDFSFWQGNRGIARRRTTVRRTSKTED
jgi:hypothetical protein